MSSCQSSHSAEKQPSEALPIISVDGVVIDETSLANELQYHQNENFGVVVQKAGQALVVKHLLLTQATEKGFYDETDKRVDNEEKAIQELISSEVTYQDPTAEDCQRYFENNADRFKTESLFEVDHILLAAAKDDLPTREVAKRNAKEIIERLKNDPMLFPALANEFSACPSKKTGGSLGQISKGQTVPEFEKQLKTMQEGLAAYPIESRYGFHVVNISRKIAGKNLEYSMVEDKVKGYLTHRASHLAIQAFIQSLIEVADIEGIKMRFTEENIHI
jgi:peptidyl-prolyl cis-trans isomerase C